MRRRAFAVVALVAQSVVGASWASPAKARGLVVHAVVVDSETNKPIAGAQVTLCRRLVERAGVVVNGEGRSCEEWFDGGRTKRNGEVALKWAGATADLDRASLLVDVRGYRDGFVSGSELLKQVGPARRLRIALTAGATISAVVTRPDGTPVADAEFGWAAQEGPGLNVRQLFHYGGTKGEASLAADWKGAPVGELTVFAVEREPSPRLAVARVVTQPGRETKVALEIRQPLVRVKAKVVTPDGTPLIASIVAEPADPAAPPIERALAAIGDGLVALGNGTTRPPGEFAVLAMPGARLMLRASTWIPGDGSMSNHVGTRPLAELLVDVASDGTDTSVVLKAPPSKVVTCTLANQQGAPLLIDGFDLSFAPHVGWGHSGGCVDTPRPADVPRTLSERVSFIWPDGADSVKVVAHSDMAQGGIRLKRPDEPCHIQTP